MRHPPYHLRVNKAVDRLMLADAIRCLEPLVGDISRCTYYGLGGPYLEEFRLLYELYPDIPMVSFEDDGETYKRQQFHLPCATLHLDPRDVRCFLKDYEAGGQRSIFWLDFTKLERSHLDTFMQLLTKVAECSLAKITLRAEPQDFARGSEEERRSKTEAFRTSFSPFLPNQSITPPLGLANFAKLLQDMLQIAAQKALAGRRPPAIFQPVSSFYYTDSTGMLSLTGVICRLREQPRVRGAFRRWEFANLDWGPPMRIDMPFLSTKERLRLEELLPCARDQDAGQTLRNALGYRIDQTEARTKAKLEQYATFHRRFPYFIRATP